jgi:hypothetical protein
MHSGRNRPCLSRYLCKVLAQSPQRLCKMLAAVIFDKPGHLR